MMLVIQTAFRIANAAQTPLGRTGQVEDVVPSDTVQ
jgi:hypothetical protein